jgi:hypothetical protein
MQVPAGQTSRMLLLLLQPHHSSSIHLQLMTHQCWQLERLGILRLQLSRQAQQLQACHMCTWRAALCQCRLTVQAYYALQLLQL